MQVDENVIFRHQLLQRFDDVVKQIVHHIVVVLPGAVGQVACAEYDDCVVTTGFEIAAMGQNALVRLYYLHEESFNKSEMKAF